MSSTSHAVNMGGNIIVDGGSVAYFPQLFDFGRLRRLPKKKESDFIKQNNKLAKAGFVIVLIALAVLCVSAVAQENTAEVWYQKGNDLERNGSYEEAVKAYDKAIEINPQYAAAWSDKGRALSRMAIFPNSISKYNESLKAFNKAIELEPLNSTIWAFKGQALTSMATFTGNESIYNESLEALDKALEISPDYSLALEWKGDALMDQGKYEKALIAYEKAIETDEIFPKLWYKKGTALKALGRNSEADATFAEAKERGYEG